jgi:hypothetical protein
MSLLERTLWLLTIASTALLAFRLYRSGLFRTYRWFFGYLCFRVVRSLLLLEFRPHSTAYGVLWALTEPLLWLLYVLITLELCGLILDRYPGIASASRWLIMGALGLSVFLSMLTLAADLSAPDTGYRILVYFNVIRRGLFSSLIIFLLVVTVFLRWYPASLSRNLITHTVVFALYFTSYAAGLLARNLMGPEVTRTFSTVQQGVAVCCLAIWLARLNAAGERRSVRIRPRLDSLDEQRILEQLETVNSNLLRTSRK